MSDLALVATAAGVFVAALRGMAVPAPLAVAAVLVAVVVRRPLPVVLALLLVVGGRSHAAAAALDAPLPSRVFGTAQLVSDPKLGPFGAAAEVRLGARRFQARVDRSQEWVLRPLMAGDHVRVVGRPRPLEGAPSGWRRSRHLAGRLDVSEIAVGPRAPPWFAAANSLHRVIASGAASFDDRTRSLYLGLVLGDDRAQSDLERFRFQATGLGHLLAVSGQNVAFMLAVARPVLSRCTLRTRWVLGLALLAAFVVLTRAEASVMRAAAMAAVALVAGTAGRVASGARVLALASIGLLALDPLLAAGLGFQLSMCATVGLLLGVRPLAARLRGPRWLAEAVASTVAAQIATAPLLVALNGGIPSVATFANVVAVPAAGFVMMLGLTVGVLAGTVVAPVATVLNAPTHLLVRWVELTADVGSRMPLPILEPDRLVILAASAATWCAAARGWRPLRFIAVALVLAVLVPVSPPGGRSDVGPGVELDVDRCGRRTVELVGRVDTSDALAALQRRGVVRADVVVGPDTLVRAEIAEQLRAVVHRRGGVAVPCTVAS